jgi:hypothetical protein
MTEYYFDPFLQNTSHHSAYRLPSHSAETNKGMVPIRHVETCPDFFFTARVHTTKSTIKILAANTPGNGFQRRRHISFCVHVLTVYETSTPKEQKIPLSTFLLLLRQAAITRTA